MEITNGDNNKISYILKNLDMFSRLPQNLSVHLDRNNNFIITAKYMSYVIGAQTSANIFKSHSTKKLIKDLHDFTQLIINVINDEFENLQDDKTSKDKKIKCAKIISIICREFKLAYNGLPDTRGGIFGLTETYKNDNSVLQLKNAISYMKESIDLTKKKLGILILNELDKSDALIDCPEIYFTDDDWENTMKIIPLLKTEYVGIFKYYINYSLILSLNKLRYNTDENRWDKIHCINGVDIYLGELPLIQGTGGYIQSLEFNDLITLYNLGIKAILSVTEIFENSSEGYIYSPVMPIDWQTFHFKHYQIPSSDFCSIHEETLHKGAAFIDWNIKNKRSIYIHCKSGKSRSFAVLMAYFIKYLGYNYDDAFNYIKSKRVQVKFGKNSAKVHVLKKFEKNIINK